MNCKDNSRFLEWLTRRTEDEINYHTTAGLSLIAMLLHYLQNATTDVDGAVFSSLSCFNWEMPACHLKSHCGDLSEKKKEAV